jgi:putative hydrolase of the HAD superfamily
VDSTSFGLVGESKTEKNGRQAGWDLACKADAAGKPAYLLCQMIRVVTFDAAGTLIRLTKSPGVTYAEAARPFGYELDPERLQAAFRIAWQTLPPPADSAGPRADDDRGWWKMLVTRTMQEAGYEVAPFNTYFDEVYSAFARPGIWELFPDVPVLLRRLVRLKIRLGVISNFDRRLYTILEDLGLLGAFENVIISSESGVSKPAARIFLEAARRFQVNPGEILHIGDDANLDGAGAIAAGCKAFVVDHETTRLERLLELLGRKSRNHNACTPLRRGVPILGTPDQTGGK